MDSIEDRVKGFFKKCGTTNNLKQEWKDEQMEKLKQVSTIQGTIDAKKKNIKVEKQY